MEHLWNLRNYPPGPFPWPIIGNLHQIDGKQQFRTCEQLAKIYGSVYSISLGMERVVIVNKIEPTREAIVEKAGDFSGRPLNNYTMNLITNNSNGLVMADYSREWLGRRKLAAKAIKIFSEQVSNLEEKIAIEASKCSERLSDYLSRPVDIDYQFRKIF